MRYTRGGAIRPFKGGSPALDPGNHQKFLLALQLLARLLVDKTGKLLELSDPALLLRRRQQASRTEKEQLAQIDRAMMGGHLSCEGTLLRGPGCWLY